jgi:hypothetical protein
MSSLEFDTGMIYEAPPEKREDPELEAKLLIFKLFLCPDQFTLSDLARLKELLGELDQ